jgi:ribosomal protein L16 Arg81 hydroxylase
MTYDLDSTLARLIAPMTPEEFFAEYYNKRTLIVRGSKDKFADLYTEQTWRRFPMTDTTAAYDTVVNGTPASKAIPILSSQVHDMYEAGLLTVGRVDHLPEIASLMDGLRASLQFPSGKNSFVDKVLCFASKDDIGYRMHWDVHHNFILQIAGQKHWHYGLTPAVEAPHNGARVVSPGEVAAVYDGQPVLMPNLAELHEATLGPGDFLYMPPGVWHAPRAVGHTMHLSVAMGHRPIFKLIVDVLKEEFGKKAQWRQGFPLNTGEERTSGAVPRRIQELFEECIADLRDDLGKMDPRVFHREWSAEVGEHHHRAPAVPPAPVERQERLRRATAVPIRYCLAPSEEAQGETDVYVYAGDRTHLALPEGALTFIEKLASQSEFVAERALEWDPDFDWPQVRSVLTQFVARGILVRAPST